AIVIAVLAAPVNSSRLVYASFFRSLILVSVIEYRTVIARKHYDRIIVKLQPIEGVEDLACDPIQFQNRVTASAHFTLTRETSVRNARHMNVVGCEIEEKRSRFLPVEKCERFGSERVGHV